MLERIAIFICRHFHQKISRPVRDEYVCLECGRRHPVLWSVDPAPPERERKMDPACSSLS